MCFKQKYWESFCCLREAFSYKHQSIDSESDIHSGWTYNCMELRNGLLFNASIFHAFAALVQSSPRPQYSALTRAVHSAAVLRVTDDTKVHQNTPPPSDHDHRQTQNSGTSQSFGSAEKTGSADARQEDPRPNTRSESPLCMRRLFWTVHRTSL